MACLYERGKRRVGGIIHKVERRDLSFLPAKKGGGDEFYSPPLFHIFSREKKSSFWSFFHQERKGEETHIQVQIAC